MFSPSCKQSAFHLDGKRRLAGSSRRRRGPLKPLPMVLLATHLLLHCQRLSLGYEELRGPSNSNEESRSLYDVFSIYAIWRVGNLDFFGVETFGVNEEVARRVMGCQTVFNPLNCCDHGLENKPPCLRSLASRWMGRCCPA